MALEHSETGVEHVSRIDREGVRRGHKNEAILGAAACICREEVLWLAEKSKVRRAIGEDSIYSVRFSLGSVWQLSFWLKG